MGSRSDQAGKRPRPTIEGTATEVTVEAADEGTSAKDETSAEAEGALPSPEDSDTADTTEANGTKDTAPSQPPPHRRGSGVRGVLSHLTAGLLGGLAGAGALAIAWTYLPTEEPFEAPDLTPLEDRIAKLETAPAPDDSGPALAKLEARLDELEARKPETPPEVTALADRVSQLEASFKAMAEAAKEGGSVAEAAAISQQISEAEARLEAKIDTALAETKTADAAAIEALKKEIAAVDAKLKALAEAELGSGDAARLVPQIAVLDERLSKIESELPKLLSALDEEAADTKTATLAIAFANLQAAVNEGRPYAAEISTLAALSPGTGDLGGLLDYEDEGIPTVPELTRAFKIAKDAALAAPVAENDGSILGRLMASAESLVKIRRIGAEAEGDTPDAVLARAEAQLEQGDLPASVKEVETLQGAQAAAFAAWLDQARARLGADKTLQRLESILLVTLSENEAPDTDETDEQN